MIKLYGRERVFNFPEDVQCPNSRLQALKGLIEKSKCENVQYAQKNPQNSVEYAQVIFVTRVLALMESFLTKLLS